MFANRMDRTVWKAGWREIGGYKKYYRSRWEANYARYLEYLRLRGEVEEWAHEPTTFWFEGIKRGVTNYLPDFRVSRKDETGILKEEYHEVKGWMDTKSATKIKRMGIYHPQVKLVIVDKPVYMKLEREFSSIVEGWEFLTKGEKDKEEEGGETPVEKKVKKPRKPKADLEKLLEV